MDTTNFRLNDIRGKIVESYTSQHFTCELVKMKNFPHDTMIVVVSFGALKRDTAIVFPVDGVIYHPDLYVRDVCDFYETFRADIWSDLYKDVKRAL